MNPSHGSDTDRVEPNPVLRMYFYASIVLAAVLFVSGVADRTLGPVVGAVALVAVTYGCLRHDARRRRRKARSDVGSSAARKPAPLEGRERSVFLGLAAGVTALFYAGMVLGEPMITAAGLALTIVLAVGVILWRRRTGRPASSGDGAGGGA